jgi:glycine oxidase
MSDKTIAVVGAGLMGRLAALSLKRLGHEVSLFEQGGFDGRQSAARAAAGMLTPLAESQCSPPWVVEMGFTGLKLWPELLASLDKWVYFQQAGSLVVAHEQDRGDIQRFSRHLSQHWPQHQVNWLDRNQLLELEPQLGRGFNQGLYLPQEGQIGNRLLLKALTYQLQLEQVNWLTEQRVEQVLPHQITVNDQQLKFDLVIDCRGIGAKEQLQDLRGVRGELFQLLAPEVNLQRPIRLMHPRYQLYIAPKPNGHFVVGATEIESDDDGPMTVRSALELLSAAYSVHPGFAEATIREQVSGIRPAFNDNHPQIRTEAGLIVVNGLYRHGFLLAPVVLQQLLAVVKHGDDFIPDFSQLIAIKELENASFSE